jgi:hypothetical protein
MAFFLLISDHFVVQDKGDGLCIEKNALHDNWDDPEGYYSKFFPFSLFLF